MSGFGSRPTAGQIPVADNRRALADALMGIPSRIGGAFTGMARQGLQSNEQFLQGRGQNGEDLYAQPFMPSLESGGRLGALSGFLTSNMALGGPAGSLGAGPSMFKKSPLEKSLEKMGASQADEAGLRSIVEKLYTTPETQYGPNPQKLVDALLGNRPDEFRSQYAQPLLDYASQTREANKGAFEAARAQQYAGYSAQAAAEKAKAEAMRASMPGWVSQNPDLSKRVDLYLGMGDTTAATRETQREYLAAIERELVNAGWGIRHQSKRGGDVTSRYLQSPDKAREIRLSDHELPTRNMDETINGRGIWSEGIEAPRMADMRAHDPKTVVERLLANKGWRGEE
jgi:hypothetical protein